MGAARATMATIRFQEQPGATFAAWRIFRVPAIAWIALQDALRARAKANGTKVAEEVRRAGIAESFTRSTTRRRSSRS